MHSALRQEIEQTLATLATPVEDGQAIRAAMGCVDVRDDTGSHLRYRAYWGHDGMTKREYFGPTFQWPKEAIAFVEQVNARGVGRPS